MKIAGIIAEYNPFHRGHEYQIRETRRITGADYIVVVMSPDFVQRGEPAITDQHTRARMALECGADLVLSLPVCYATGSAQYFARGAVNLLHQLGCVDYLSFGCETADLSILHCISDLLYPESEEYRSALLSFQKQGLSFPAARKQAVLSCLTEHMENQQNESASASFRQITGYSSSDIELCLDQPNNILALEYLQALKLYHSSMQPVPILRCDQGYHAPDSGDPFISASAIREKLMENISFSEELSRCMPGTAADILKDKAVSNRLISWQDFSHPLPYTLYQLYSKEITSNVPIQDSRINQDGIISSSDILDLNDDISNRIRNLLFDYRDPQQFAALLKTRQITHTRILRILLHILLDIRSADVNAFCQDQVNYYARVLGFRKESSPLLGQISKNASVPLITTAATAQKNIPARPGMSMLDQDIRAFHIYQTALTVRSRKPVQNFYTSQPVILK